MASTRFRKAVASDLPRLLECWQTSVAATHAFLTAEDLAQIAALVEHEYLPGADLDVAVDEDDRPLAFMGMTADEIDALFVHADARRAGLGRSLVDLALGRAALVRTEVNEQNRDGVAFWTAMGFRTVGRSATDRQGRAYPLLIMERPGRAPPPSGGGTA